MACMRDAPVHKFTFPSQEGHWEEEGILSLLSLLADLDVDVHAEGEVKINRSLESNGTFSIKSLCKRMLGFQGPYLPVKAIWKSKAPTKACFLAWGASKGNVPMEIMLRRRNFNLASRCAMCLKRKNQLTTSLSIVNDSMDLFALIFGSFLDWG